jgi:2'-5' RNA ligase
MMSGVPAIDQNWLNDAHKRVNESIEKVLSNAPNKTINIGDPKFVTSHNFESWDDYNKLIEKVLQSSNLVADFEKLQAGADPAHYDYLQTMFYIDFSSIRYYNQYKEQFDEIEQQGKNIVLVNLYYTPQASEAGYLNNVISIRVNPDTSLRWIHTTIKHELTHYMQDLLARVYKMKNHPDNEDVNFEAGLPFGHRPERYHLYGNETGRDSKHLSKMHALSDVEFYSRLSDCIEILKRKEIEPGTEDLNDFFKRFVESDKSLNYWKQYEPEKFEKAIKILFQEFKKHVELQNKTANVKSDKPVKKEKSESGNTIYRYDEKHISKRWKEKKEKIKKLEKDIKKVREQYKKDLKSDDQRTRAIAAIVGLIDLTSIRVGNKDSAKENKTYGATTLKVKHIKFSGGGARLKFKGKSNVDQDLKVSDSKVVSVLKELTKGKSQDDSVFEVEGKQIWDRAVNRYLSPFGISAKDIRGFNANKLMKDKLKSKDFDEALKEVAKIIGHEESTLKNQYLDPDIVKKYVKADQQLPLIKSPDAEEEMSSGPHNWQEIVRSNDIDIDRNVNNISPKAKFQDPRIKLAWRIIAPFLLDGSWLTSAYRNNADQAKTLLEFWNNWGVMDENGNWSNKMGGYGKGYFASTYGKSLGIKPEIIRYLYRKALKGKDFSSWELKLLEKVTKTLSASDIPKGFSRPEVAAPGKSFHQQDMAFDVGGPDINLIAQRIEYVASALPESIQLLKKPRIEGDANKVVHVVLSRSPVMPDMRDYVSALLGIQKNAAAPMVEHVIKQIKHKYFGGGGRDKPRAVENDDLVVARRGNSYRIKPGVKVNRDIALAWKYLLPKLPDGAVMTSGARDEEDQARIIRNYWNSSGLAVRFPDITDLDEMAKKLRQNEIIVAGVRTSPHLKGNCFDISGANLDEIVSAAKEISDDSDIPVSFSQILKEDKNDAVHIGIGRVSEAGGVIGICKRAGKPGLTEWPKKCGCGREYTEEGFYNMPFKQETDVDMEDPERGRVCGKEYGLEDVDLVHRNCECGSTMVGLFPCIHKRRLITEQEARDRYKLEYGGNKFATISREAVELSKYEKEKSDPKWNQILIDSDKKWARKQIRDHYLKHPVSKMATENIQWITNKYTQEQGKQHSPIIRAQTANVNMDLTDIFPELQNQNNGEYVVSVEAYYDEWGEPQIRASLGKPSNKHNLQKDRPAITDDLDLDLSKLDNEFEKVKTIAEDFIRKYLIKAHKIENINEFGEPIISSEVGYILESIQGTVIDKDSEKEWYGFPKQFKKNTYTGQDFLLNWVFERNNFYRQPGQLKYRAYISYNGGGTVVVWGKYGNDPIQLAKNLKTAFEKLNEIDDIKEIFDMSKKIGCLHMISKRASKLEITEFLKQGSKYEQEKDDPKWKQVLIDADRKWTRKEIRDHYLKNADKILKEIKGKPVMIYVNTGKTNQNVLKRNHNDKPIIFNSKDDLEYWADRRLLSIHRVFQNPTDFGLVDLDIHDGIDQSKVNKYAKEIAAKIASKYNTKPKIYSSGSKQGLHIEFDLNKKMDTDKLRNELKELCSELNEEYEGFTTGIVKGKGVRTDTTILKENGNIRVPWAIHEKYGGVKKPIGAEKTSWLNISKRADQISGGLADEKSPEDFEEAQLKKGIEVELEHTDDRDLAEEIAMDHLTEDPKYYDKLEIMEKGAASKKDSNGDPSCAGVFVKWPKEIAKQFPSTSEFDSSPPHITVLFIGEIPKKHKVVAKEIIKRVCMEFDPFEVKLDNKVSYFPATKNSNGCKVAKLNIISKDLKKLNKRLRGELESAEIKVDNTFPVYKPHTTIEYMESGKEKYDGVIPSGSFVVGQVEIWDGDDKEKVNIGRKISKRAGKYDHINFKPPQSVADAAARGLEWRKKNKGRGGLSSGQAKSEGVGSGVQRAVNLKNRDTLSPSTVRRMKAFFDRHQKSKAVEKGKQSWEDRGRIAWELWGGDPGYSWAKKVVRQMDAADKKSKANLQISKRAWEEDDIGKGLPDFPGDWFEKLFIDRDPPEYEIDADKREAESLAKDNPDEFFYRGLHKDYPDFEHVALEHMIKDSPKFYFLFNYQDREEEEFQKLLQTAAEQLSLQDPRSFFYYGLNHQFPELGRGAIVQLIHKDPRSFGQLGLERDYPDYAQTATDAINIYDPTKVEIRDVDDE